MAELDKEFLTFARRLHYSFRREIEDGDGQTDEDWINIERPIFEHYSCAMYLTGCLAFIEGKLGKSAWNNPGKNFDDFDTFLTSLTGKLKKNFFDFGVSKKGLDALVCIRNAITHKDNNVSNNRDALCKNKIFDANIRGVSIEENIITLSSNDTVDFMGYVRQSLAAVSNYHEVFGIKN